MYGNAQRRQATQPHRICMKPQEFRLVDPKHPQVRGRGRQGGGGTGEGGSAWGQYWGRVVEGIELEGPERVIRNWCWYISVLIIEICKYVEQNN